MVSLLQVPSAFRNQSFSLFQETTDKKRWSSCNQRENFLVNSQLASHLKQIQAECLLFSSKNKRWEKIKLTMILLASFNSKLILLRLAPVKTRVKSSHWCLDWDQWLDKSNKTSLKSMQVCSHKSQIPPEAHNSRDLQTLTAYSLISTTTRAPQSWRRTVAVTICRIWVKVLHPQNCLLNSR